MTDAPDNDPLLGRVIDGKFTLQSVLGRGGMGVVYRAHQKSLERSVALKLMTGVDPDREVEFQRRFFLEAATAAKLKHPNTITVFDYGSASLDGERVYWITMELLEGETLSKVLSKEAPLPTARALHIGLQICRSLREAHAGGVVHRDLKPGNIMLVHHDDDEVDGDFVKVLDFGLAKTRAGGPTPQLGLTKAGTFMGSPRYVAPEQIEGRPVDARADIYSFGCVLYRMLTGRVPFDGEQAVEIMLKHLNEPVPAPGVALPAELERLVLACLAKKAGDRPSSMEEVIASIKRVRAELLGVTSGATNIPDDVRRHLEAIARGESTTPSQVAPPSPSLPPRTGVADARTSLSNSSPSSPSSSAPTLSPPASAAGSDASAPVRPRAGARSSSSSDSYSTPSRSGANWSLGERVIDEQSRPSSALGRPTGQRPRRGGLFAALSGLALGLVLVAGGIAWRMQDLRTTPLPPPPAPGPVATASVSARIRISTTPRGADVLDITTGVPKLLGVTPVVVPWDLTPGARGRTLLLRKEGFISARAPLDPPVPSMDGRVVWIDVDATLRPAPATAPAPTAP